MAQDSDMRRFVEMLICMLHRNQGIPDLHEDFIDFESQFRAWVYRLASKFYFHNTMLAMGYEEADFCEDCLCLLFRKVKQNPEWIMKPEMNDRILGGYLITIAKNLQRDFGRRREGRLFVSLQPCLVDDNWDGEPEEYINTENYEHPEIDFELAYKFERAHFIISEFILSKRLGTKELETLNAMLYYYKTDGIINLAISRYWIVYQLLERTGDHLPTDLQEHLQQTFPKEKYANISQRKTDLRKKFRQFLNDNPYLKGFD